ncbi:probable G-protein coupled receptor Mth-like 3 isoform X2 [Penaeus chinensis]|uniref:probable G-protein coupled receptor Mth-like 3 isoform X1 n=1 Tax=Penaeus chinensis TaxID=139456 RepID=UPI001FB75591|nr:probable G-protein coupled receptor Mth-like 3 isoform X1 [Penaeus chinensis]XP_047501052.1 probable G-protein coupled receptor Mth-like 3 isoform X2 [Penaeus chinensis]
MHLALLWLCAACVCAVTATTTLPPQLPAPNPANLTLRKCFCGAGQAWDGAQCVDAEETLVAVMDQNERVSLFDSRDFGQVITGQITCPDLREPAVLPDTDIVFITTTDRAYWWNQRQLFKEFCIEHTPKLEVRVCLHPPIIPRCCLPGHVLEKNGSCTPRDAIEFNPPVSLQFTGQPINFPDTNAADTVEEVTCQGLAVPHRADLSGSSDILLYNVNKAHLVWLPPSEYALRPEVTMSYCVGVEAGSSISEAKYVAVVCYTDQAKVHRHICANGTCVRKCCAADKVFTADEVFTTSEVCRKAESPKDIWQPSLHFNKSRTPKEDISDDLIVVSGLPLCKHFFDLNPEDEKDKHFLLGNGSLHVPAYGTYNADKYCLDLQRTSTGQELITILCTPPTQETECKWKNVLVLVLLCISCVFLFATLIVYVSVVELRDRTNGRCLISMVAAMLATYVSLAVNRKLRDVSDGACITRGFIGHVCSLATFFWLNVMCFDMWLTLRSSQQKYQSVKVFVFYSIYAWGSPLLIGCVGLILDLVEAPNVIRPHFLHQTCWFQGEAEFWTYLSGIILVLLVVNLFFFIHVAITLARKLRQRKSLFDNKESRASNANKKNKEHVWLFVRLFIVMGVVWVAEILSLLHRGSCSYWVLTDILNSLQGVFIFGVAVCNKDNIKKIKRSWKTRYTTVRSKVGTIKSARLSEKTTQAKRFTDLSVAASEASRKTSVTSLPRKLSTASNAVLPASNANSKGNRLTDQSLSSEAASAPRKISTVSNLEMIPMSSMEE